MEIGGLSRFKIIGEDTIKGDKLKNHPPAKGKIPWALRRDTNVPSGECKIIWKDEKGQLREGTVRVKES